MTDLELQLLIDLHLGGERQGPGSTAHTLRALDAVALDRNKTWQVADIGCGTGSQTMVLANYQPSHITAVDFLPEFLQELEVRAGKLSLKSRIETLAASMDLLPFAAAALDLIWSEGAIYNMGFQNGLRTWRNFLKVGGFIGLSEIVWLRNDPPETLQQYWNHEYPEMGTVADKLRILEEEGFSPQLYFPLDEDAWMEHYYWPIQERLPAFLERHQGVELAREIVQREREEIHLYQSNKAFYSYGFFVAQRVR